ncbi:hypothetical protein AOY38_05140 [Synechocystis sp. PCC 6803]|nr:hypothetical protein AOY38_05140 [Synechocystis sp. PCC 6803]
MVVAIWSKGWRKWSAFNPTRGMELLMNSDIFKIRPNFTVQILLFSEREGIVAATINQGPRATSKGGFEQLTQSLNFGKS